MTKRSLTQCEECKVDYDKDGVCPNCGNTRPAPGDPEVKTDRQVSERGGKSGKARQASQTLKTRVAARPSTVVNTIKAMFDGVAGNSPMRRRTDVSLRSSSKRRGFAAGLVEVAPQPPVLPDQLVKPGLTIPNDQRFCFNPDCSWLKDKEKNPQGTPRNLYKVRKDGSVADKVWCGSCEKPFNFGAIPPQTMIGQYEIVGPVAVGGCGFIYAAWDVNVGRHVILKGLLNSSDPEQQLNAVVERSFLAELKDSHIVQILNFVTHEDPETQEKQTFIVMEFIDGQTLKSLKKAYMESHKDEKGKPLPLPLTVAIYYMLGILPAFAYLHKTGVLYCDFKMDNGMVQGERLRLIDLGGARKINDVRGDFYLTRGYAAPEACTKEPIVSISSDLYTIGRTLAILALNFDWTDVHEFDLPTPDEEPLFAKYECFYRFLLRACHHDPDQRFQSADEMADQLLGVLNEIVSIDAAEPRPVTSALFAADVLKESGKPTFRSIPDLKIDQDDAARSLIETALALSSVNEQLELYQQAIQQFPKSVEARLRLAGLYTDTGKFLEAEALIAECVSKDPFDFRNIWMRGRLLLAQGKLDGDSGAFSCFDAVFSEVPGELAPKLALAIVSELQGDLDKAIKYYELVSGVDRNFVTAAFGLARCWSLRDNAEAAADAYERVPVSSISYVPALVAKVSTLLRGNPDTAAFEMIAQTLDRISSNTLETCKLRAETLLIAIKQMAAGLLQSVNTFKIAGALLHMDTLRDALSREFAACASHAEYLPELKLQVTQVLERSPDEAAFDMLGLRLEEIPTNTLDLHLLRAEVLMDAITLLAAGKVKPKSTKEFKLFGVEFAEKPLRDAAERELRACAQMAERGEDKIRYVNMANEFRNRQAFSWL